MPAPRYNKKPDKNHDIPKDFMRYACGGYEAIKDENGKVIGHTAFYQGYKLVLRDTSKQGGLVTDYDLYCVDTNKMVLLEVKTEEAYAKKNHDTTTGEAWLWGNVKNMRFVVTDEDMLRVAGEIILC